MHKALALVLAAAAGCTMMMSAMTPKPRVAPNPLTSGQPVEASTKASLGVLGEKDCDRWPFEDSVSVAVTEQQICISTKKHVEQSPGWTGEPTANSSDPMSVSNDAGQGGSITVEKKHASKVGMCFDPGYNAKVGIWEFEYQGCAPNNGTITATTKSMTVGSESWSFGGPATASNQ